MTIAPLSLFLECAGTIAWTPETRGVDPALFGASRSWSEYGAKFLAPCVPHLIDDAKVIIHNGWGQSSANSVYRFADAAMPHWMGDLADITDDPSIASRIISYAGSPILPGKYVAKEVLASLCNLHIKPYGEFDLALDRYAGISREPPIDENTIDRIRFHEVDVYCEPWVSIGADHYPDSNVLGVIRTTAQRQAVPVNPEWSIRDEDGPPVYQVCNQQPPKIPGVPVNETSFYLEQCWTAATKPNTRAACPMRVFCAVAPLFEARRKQQNGGAA